MIKSGIHCLCHFHYKEYDKVCVHWTVLLYSRNKKTGIVSAPPRKHPMLEMYLKRNSINLQLDIAYVNIVEADSLLHESYFESLLFRTEMVLLRYQIKQLTIVMVQMVDMVISLLSIN